MENIYLKRTGRIYYRHPDGRTCVYHQEGEKFYAECGKDDRIVLYALDDGTFTKMRLMMSDRIRFTYDDKRHKYIRGSVGPVTIKGHYPFFIAYEKKKKPTPVHLDIDGNFSRKPINNFKEKLRNHREKKKPKKYAYPVLEGKFKCLQCRQPIENVKKANRQFCSVKCAKIHWYVRSKEKDYVILDYRTNRDLEEDGLLPPAFYYVCVNRVSKGGQVRVDWIGGPYESENAATAASGPFLVRYAKDHGWSNGHACFIKRLTKDKPTFYRYKP